MQIVKHLTRAAIKFFPANHAELARLASKKNVFTNCHLPDERQLLIDNCYSGLFRIAHAAELLKAAIDENFAAIIWVWIDATEDFHQGRLSGAVLSNQRVNLTLMQIQADAIERTNTREGLRDVPH